MLRSCQQVQREWAIKSGARIAGVHFYGPYFAEDKVGCHRLEARSVPGEWRAELGSRRLHLLDLVLEVGGKDLCRVHVKPSGFPVEAEVDRETVESYFAGLGEDELGLGSAHLPVGRTKA